MTETVDTVLPAPRPQKVPTRSATQHIVAVFVLTAFFALIILLAWHSVPQENKETLEIVLGVMGGSFSSIVNFYFGSTSSSHEKDETINKLSVTPIEGKP